MKNPQTTSACGKPTLTQSPAPTYQTMLCLISLQSCPLFPNPPYHGTCSHCIMCVPVSSLPKPMVHPVTKSKLRTVSLVAESCLTLCNPMDCSTPGFPVHCQLPEFTQTHVHWVGDAIQPSHPLLFPSPRAFNFSQHQGLFQWVGSSHQVAKILEFQLQHQSFQ